MPADTMKALRVTSPFSQEVVAEVPWDTATGVDSKLDRARQAQLRWRTVPLEKRMSELAAALAYFRGAAEEIARDVSLQMGKPIAQARREVDTMLARAEHLIVIGKYALAPDVLPAPSGMKFRIEHHPVGVVLDIAAWNYPLLVPVNVVVPALLAGNSVLLKHSPLTPLCGVHFERAFASLSVPNLVQNVVVENKRAEELIEDSRIDYVAFTGSVATGRKVHRATAKRGIGAGLELGGKDPAYVAEDADVFVAAQSVVDGACYNAGQSCCAVERVYVHESLYEAFLERARTEIKQYRMGDPLDVRTNMGPLARREGVETVASHVEDAVLRGAKVLAGGRRVTGKAWFFEPTLIAGVPNEALAMREESFGPIVPVASVASDEEAIARMNDSRYGLTASVWTKSCERAERFAKEIEAGTVYQNRCDYLDPALPWTGWKDSGLGSTLSRYGFLGLTRRKSVHFKG